MYIAKFPRMGVAGALLLPSPLHAHGPLTGSSQPLVATVVTAIVPAVLMLVLWSVYIAGVQRRPVPWQQRVCFHAAILVCGLAIFGPLDAWAESNAAAHMSQHMLMMVIIPPLFVMSRPLPQFSAMGVQSMGALAWKPLLRAARHPLWMAWLHGAVIWLWHLPRFYVLALNDPWWHFIEHMCFLITGGLFWWSVMRSTRRNAAWALLAVLFTLMHTGFLGALLTFAHAPLYLAAYPPDATAVEGIARRLAEQQLAGLIMWVAGGIPYMCATIWIAQRWYQQLTRQMQTA